MTCAAASVALTVDKFGGTLCVRGGGEHCSIISCQHFQPSSDVGRVVFARLESDSEVRAQERSAELGHELFAGVAHVAEALAAEIT